jgi:ATP-dependent Lon protease
LRIVAEPLTHLRQVLDLKEDIRDEIEGDMSRTARERLLRERLRSIKEELGEADGDSAIDEYLDKVAESGMSDEARKVVRRELGRMRLMDPSSPQYNIGRTYVEWLLDIPWGVITDDTFDVPAARAILEAEHSGLAKVKRRILEFIAVRKLAPEKSGAILCLVGPPGVGKTSLGRSIATALGREYVRVALGGVRDESAVRGHRRTYIGALPGRFITSLKKAGSMNPVFVLDEIDKLGSDHRGDPTSALLEVLDPEQNHEFSDHYVDVPVDLSKVMFIATANMLETIPAPLLDRLEVIQVPGYTEREKLEIARKHLLPKQIAEHGIEKDQIELDEDIITAIILHHTREAGVRNLERELASVCRAAAVQVASGKSSVTIDEEALKEILGPPRFVSEVADRDAAIGVATGLAWTPVGGTILFIEARAMPGKGQLKLTGQVGDVMSESMTAAMSYVRSRAEALGIPNERFEDTDVHIHLPSGGIKKDGPSAGVAVTTTLVSLLTARPVRADVAITGEVTLRGLVLPVGGIKEKVLAAHRAGIKTVVLPLRNKKDLVDVPDEVKDELTIKLVTKVAEAMEIALATDEGTDEPTSPIPPPSATDGASSDETFAE